MTITIAGNDKGQLSITIPYDKAIITAIKKVSDYRWDSERKAWVFPDTQGHADLVLRVLFATGLFSAPIVNTAEKLGPQDLFIEPYREAPIDKQSPSIQRYLAALTARHYSGRTKESYEKWLRRFLESTGDRSPKALGSADINSFLSHLAVDEEVSASTQNQALAALLFFFRNVLNVPVSNIGEVIRAKKPKRLPVVMSRQEVRAVLSELQGEKWLAASLIYGTGIRLMECLELRIQDIDFARNEILVRNGKGGKDRHTMLPATLKDQL